MRSDVGQALILSTRVKLDWKKWAGILLVGIIFGLIPKSFQRPNVLLDFADRFLFKFLN